MQEAGPREAIEAVRKRLKHGTTQQKLRVIDVRLPYLFIFLTIIPKKEKKHFPPFLFLILIS